MQLNSLKNTNEEVHFYQRSILEACNSTKNEFLHRYFSRILNENLRILLSGCFRINLDSLSLNQKVVKTTFVEINLQQIEKRSFKSQKISDKNYGKNCFLENFLFLPPLNNVEKQWAKLASSYVSIQPRKFYGRRNNNKVDSIETGLIVIADLLPWSDLEVCVYSTLF